MACAGVSQGIGRGVAAVLVPAQCPTALCTTDPQQRGNGFQNGHLTPKLNAMLSDNGGLQRGRRCTLTVTTDDLQLQLTVFPLEIHRNGRQNPDVCPAQ